MNDIARIAAWVKPSERVVAFTGAGISTESGIPDYRSPGGIWATSQPVYYDDFLASATARHEYWRQKAVTHRDFASSRPNAGHEVLARWEAAGRLRCVITQNIDGLHQQAGSQQVWELHGTAREVSCLSCQARFSADGLVQQFLSQDAVPTCPQCGSELMKHATISFGQSLDAHVLEQAATAAQKADVFLAISSSLVVEPAASLPRLARAEGARLVIINRDSTPQDELADLAVRAPIGETLSAVDSLLGDPRRASSP